MKRLETTISDTRFFLLLFTVHLLQILKGIYHHAYIGHDFELHVAKIQALATQFQFSFKDTNPPLYYLLAAPLRLLVPQYALPLTAFFTACAGALSLLLLYQFLKPVFKNRLTLRLVITLLTFLPFRVLSATAISADTLSILPFALLLPLISQRFRNLETGTPPLQKNTLLISGILSFAILGKYSAVNYLIGIGILLLLERKTRLKSVVLLSIPVFIFTAMLYASYLDKSYTTHKHFETPPGAAHEMNVKDLLFIKTRDLTLLSAPNYGSLREKHRYSYFGLLHLTSFTDYANLYQPPLTSLPLTQRSPDRGEIFTPRTSLSRVGNILSVVLALPLSLSAFLAIFYYGMKRKKAQVKALLLLSLSFFMPFFLVMPLTHATYTCAYFLPRLTAPALLGFLILGLIFITEKWAVTERKTSLFHLYLTLLSLSFFAAL